MRLSPHFEDSELWCQCCHECHVTPQLLGLAEDVRAVLGNTAMYVNQHDHSAYRCEEHNKEVGGVENSYHMQGMAMDFDCRGCMTPAQIYKNLVDARMHGELRNLWGIGLYDTFVHIDTGKAPDGHLRTWDERSKTDDRTDKR